MQFIYQGLENNLDALLKVRASPSGWISVTYMTEKIKRFALNWIFSLVTLGRQPHYIIAVFEDESLAACKALNLPCFNATALAPVKIENMQHTLHGSQLQWTKIHVSYQILVKGYHLHASDSDVVYLRNLNKSYDLIFKDTHADAIFAPEEGVLNSQQRLDLESWASGSNKEIHLNIINSGVYAVTSTNRSITMFYRWWHERSWDDQGWLNRFHGKAHVICSGMMACLTLQRAGWMTIFLHAPFYEGRSCWANPEDRTPGMKDEGGVWSPRYGCDTRRLYVHFLCGCCWQLKTDSFEAAKLWLIGEDLKPKWERIGANGNSTHPFLPCQEDTAWKFDPKHTYPRDQYDHSRLW